MVSALCGRGGIWRRAATFGRARGPGCASMSRQGPEASETWARMPADDPIPPRQELAQTRSTLHGLGNRLAQNLDESLDVGRQVRGSREHRRFLRMGEIPVLPQEGAAGLARRVAELIAEIGPLRQDAERDIDSSAAKSSLPSGFRMSHAPPDAHRRGLAERAGPEGFPARRRCRSRSGQASRLNGRSHCRRQGLRGRSRASLNSPIIWDQAFASAGQRTAIAGTA